MFIKIKLESKDYNRNQTADVNAPFFEINSDAPLIEAKVKIESYVNVPAARLQIKTLTKSYQNQEKIIDIWNVEQKEGASMMLCALPSNEENLNYNEHCEPQFLCFLQLFKSKEAITQTSFESSHKSIRSLSNASSITLVADSSESETEPSSQSQSSSQGSSTDSTDSDDSQVKKRRKRKTLTPSEEVKAKIPKHMVSCANISPTLFKYLEDFPRYSQNQTPSGEKQCQISSTGDTEKQDNFKTSDQAIIQSKCLSGEKSPRISTSTNNVVTMAKSIVSIITSPTTKNSTALAVEKCVSEPIQVSTTTTVNREEKDQPVSAIPPEKRDFIVIISSTTKTISNGDCTQLLNVFFEKFRQSRNSSRLHFNDKYAFMLHHGQLWISCEDNDTTEWMLEKSLEFSDAYKVERMRDCFKFISYAVVVPCVCKSNNLKEVFALLENQNMHLHTNRWIVQKRNVISNESDAYYDRTVCYFCPNEVLHILIDEESKIFLDKCNFKLNYCFWKVILFDVK